MYQLHFTITQKCVRNLYKKFEKKLCKLCKKNFLCKIRPREETVRTFFQILANCAKSVSSNTNKIHNPQIVPATTNGQTTSQASNQFSTSYGIQIPKVQHPDQIRFSPPQNHRNK